MNRLDDLLKKIQDFQLSSIRTISSNSTTSVSQSEANGRNVQDELNRSFAVDQAKSLIQRKLERRVQEIADGLNEEIEQLYCILFQKSECRKLIFSNNGIEMTKIISKNEERNRLIALSKNKGIEVKELVLIVPMYAYFSIFLGYVVNLSECPDFIKNEILPDVFEKIKMQFFFDGNLDFFHFLINAEMFVLLLAIDNNINVYCFEGSEKETQLKQFLDLLQNAIYDRLRSFLETRSEAMQLKYFGFIYKAAMTNKKLKEFYLDPYVMSNLQQDKF